jgi:dephospho-CoA kinase
MYILLTGYARAGKNTVADLLDLYLSTTYPTAEVRQEALAEPIKEVAHDLLWPFINHNRIVDDSIQGNDVYKFAKFDVLGEEGRAFLQWFGTEVMQKAFHKRFKNSNVEKNTFWCKHLFYRSRNADFTIITDVRFPHEIEYFKNVASHDVVVINVDRGMRKNWWERMTTHKSERYAETMPFDIRITNDGDIEKLIEQVQYAIEHNFNSVGSE